MNPARILPGSWLDPGWILAGSWLDPGWIPRTSQVCEVRVAAGIHLVQEQESSQNTRHRQRRVQMPAYGRRGGARRVWGGCARGWGDEAWCGCGCVVCGLWRDIEVRLIIQPPAVQVHTYTLTTHHTSYTSYTYYTSYIYTIRTILTTLTTLNILTILTTLAPAVEVAFVVPHDLRRLKEAPGSSRWWVSSGEHQVVCDGWRVVHE